jgi:hypothetical protein
LQVLTSNDQGWGIVLQKLVSVVRNNDQPAVAPGFLRPIDTARIARDFKIEAIAGDRGEHNLPETRDANLDAIEQKIIQKNRKRMGVAR